MNDIISPLRKDLEFFPIRHQGRDLILIKDSLGLVREGMVIEPPLYQLMIMLDGKRSIYDLQVMLMRQRGGLLVARDEIRQFITSLDKGYLLESDQYRAARNRIIEDFAAMKVRPPSHSGHAYPADPQELRKRLDAILESQSSLAMPEGKILALVAPHIDISVGTEGYSCAYRLARSLSPDRVIVLGVGHQMGEDLFSLTEKDFNTPLGIVETDRSLVTRLREAGGEIVSPHDFAHRSEHSIEFQVLFLQHTLKKPLFKIIPVLCGFLPSSLPEFRREAYLQDAKGFIEVLRDIITDPHTETLVVAGVDFCHIGPKFGHEMSAHLLERESLAHDQSLLDALAEMDADRFWEESGRVKDQYHVCGFSALACLLEILPPCRGRALCHRIWHEEATRSAVSFAAMAFES